MTDKFEISRRKALLGLGTIGLAGAGAGVGTSALFKDDETFKGNSIQAGTSNLKVEMALAGASNPGLMDINFDVGETREADGDEVVTGIQVGDIKPGDWLLIRTTVDVVDNPMYVAAEATNLADSENGESDPESTGSGPDTGSDFISGAGDLDNELNAEFGYDSDRGSLHDNTLEGAKGDLGQEYSGNLTGLLDNLSTDGGYLYRGRQGADPGSGQPGGHSTDGTDAPTRIGDDTSASNVDRDKVTHWLYLELPIGVGNNVQGDSVSWDLEFRAEQARNNADPTVASDVDGSPN